MAREFMQMLQLFAFLAVVSVSMSANVTMMGDCNMTYFTQEAFKCQRVALEETHKFNRSCTNTFDKQETCIEKHAEKCTQFKFQYNYVISARNVLKILTFNCLGLTYRVLDKFINEELKCNRSLANVKGMLSRIPRCWEELATKSKANPQDPALCGVYKQAKQCVVNETSAYCPGMQLELDQCNTFCANGSDDSRPCPPIPFTFDDECNNLTVMYKEAVSCQKSTVVVLQESRDANPCSDILKRDAFCYEYFLDKCWKPIRDANEFDQMKNLFSSVTWAKKFFCQATPYDVSDLSAKVKNYIPGCTNTFFTEGDKCGTELRQVFAANKNDKRICQMYADAKKCYYKVMDKHCSFPDEVIGVFKDNTNPFCKDYKDPTSSATPTATTGSEARSFGRAVVVLGSILSTALMI